MTGVGGCGKTQLCLRLAADLAPSVTDGAWLVQLAAQPELMSANRADTIDRLAADEANLSAALNVARRSAHTADIELGLRLAASLAWFWNFRGQAAEGLDWSVRDSVRPAR